MTLWPACAPCMAWMACLALTGRATGHRLLPIAAAWVLLTTRMNAHGAVISKSAAVLVLCLTGRGYHSPSKLNCSLLSAVCAWLMAIPLTTVPMSLFISGVAFSFPCFGKGSSRGGKRFGAGSKGSTWAGSAARPQRLVAVKKEFSTVIRFLRPYPDKEGNCINDYGKGRACLDAQTMSPFLNHGNSEFKNRLEFAVSFTASAMLSMWSVLQRLPPGSALPAEYKGTLFSAISDIRDILAAPDGQAFLEACTWLNMSKDMSRKPGDAKPAPLCKD